MVPDFGGKTDVFAQLQPDRGSVGNPADALRSVDRYSIRSNSLGSILAARRAGK